ncbi:hypothetical protein R3P38DRAFT_3327238 [Favolaschia claudopus]|uniref:SWIM-type domain-containing protein n=1 Tax=Favolaschia claudopus TaxID=2862362 RepID=A0AAW0A5N3_9AGAR
MQRIPALPLHPSLANGVSLTDIQQRNREWDCKHRWLLQRYDTRSLYRQFSRLDGVKLTEKPHINLDEWLNPNSPQYNPTLASAIFHYSARTSKDERLEMKEAAWKYGYKSQIVVDGTFGVCDSRLLLFIVMGIDEEKKGNQLSSSGYDTSILAKLLKTWRASLEKFRDGKPFVVLERGALLQVFPFIVLLICKFHLRQSWRNHRNKLVKGKSAESLEVKARLRLVEEKLVATTTWDERRTSHGAPAEKGLLHLDYLSSYWLSYELWASWSDFGRYTAAGILGCGFEGSFNGLLKRKYLRRWQRGGRRLRVDVLINVIVNKRRLQGLERERALLLSKRIVRDETPTPVAFFVPDESRDTAAAQLLQNNQISAPEFDADTFKFSCYSSLATEFDEEPRVYTIQINVNGTASCNGPDFTKNGGACKHIRAAMLKIHSLRLSIPNLPIVTLPASEQEARILLARLTFDSAQKTAPPSHLSTPSPTVLAAQAINELLQVNDVAHARHDTSDDSDDSSEDELELSDDDDDNKSVATDASEDGEDLNVGHFIRRHSGITAVAIDNQAIARVTHELSRHAPKIQELSVCLRDAFANDTHFAIQQQFNALMNQMEFDSPIHPSAQSKR